MPATIDYFAVTTDVSNASDNSLTLSGYDLEGRLLGSVTYYETGVHTPVSPIVLTGIGQINKVVVSITLHNPISGGIGIDLVTFGPPRPHGGPPGEFVFPTSPLKVADLCWDTFSSRLFATVRSDSPTLPNHLVTIDPETREIQDHGSLGNAPSVLAGDSQGTLFIALNGTMEILALDSVTLQTKQRFSVGAGTAIEDIAVSPANPSLLAVARVVSPSQQQTVLFANGIARPTPIAQVFRNIAFTEDGSVLFGKRLGYPDLFRAPVSGTELLPIDRVHRDFSPGSLAIGSGYVYFDTGDILRWRDRARVPSLPGIGANPAMALRDDMQTLAFLSKKAAGWSLDLFQNRTFAQLHEANLGTQPDSSTGLVMISPALGAFRTETDVRVIDVRWAVGYHDLALSENVKLPFGTDDPSARVPFVYEFAVRNNGTLTALNVVLTHTLPAGFVLRSAVFEGRSVAAKNGLFTGKLAQLQPGERAVFTITAIPPAEGQYDLKAEATSDGLEANAADNRRTLTARVQSAARLSIADARTVEDKGDFYLPVRLSHRIDQQLAVAYEFEPGTAEAGSDFQATSAVLKIPAGSTEGLIRVRMKTDAVAETDEYFRVVALQADGAVIEKAGLILVHDDDAPYLTIEGSQAFESEPLSFLVRLSAPQPSAVLVRYATLPGTADDADYASVQGMLEFPPGWTIQFVPVSTYLDPQLEPDETMSLLLYDAVGANILQGDGTGVIQNRTPQQAAFRITSLNVEGGAARMEFSGEEQGQYQLQYGRATAVGPPGWQDLGASVTATGKSTVIEVQLPDAHLPEDAGSSLFRVRRVK